LRGQRHDEPPGGGEDAVEARRQLRGRQLDGRAVVHADERGIARRVPAMDGPAVQQHRGDTRHAEAAELLEAGGITFDVHRVELDPPRREELLRLGAAASAGAIEEPGAHGHHLTLVLKKT
jgi:hypothetical protein